MWRRLIQRQRAFVDRVDLRCLGRMKGPGRQRKVRVASRLGKNLHFRIDAASVSAGRVGQSKISMHKTVAGLVGAWFQRKTAMTKRQVVAKFGQGASSIFGPVATIPSVMKMNLDRDPSPIALIR